MNLATSYAKALFEVTSKDEVKASEVLKNLREALRRRGHEKLLPRIYSEFEKLQIKENRLTEHKKVTPEAARTRMLLELYQKLISTPAN
jgi:F0F1-type ATP synthase delta subunit